MNNFSELTLQPILHANLARNGFTIPTPVQAQSLPGALEGRDVVATAQTGTGKTLAFVIPILETLIKTLPAVGIQALVLSPTRELAQQINETFQKLAAGTGLRAATVVGGLNESNQLRMIRGGAQVVIATPGRLCDFLDRRLVKLAGVKMLVLDEADRMLDMGFLPAIQTITAALSPERQNLMFSATIQPSVKHLIEKYCKNPIRISCGSPTKPAEHVDLHVYEVEQDRKLGLLSHMLEKTEGSYLVFARTKRGVDKLAKRLSQRGVSVGNIHGDRSQSQRNQALRSFQQGHHRVLVATDVAARGIHVENIAHVVNYDMPNAPEDFIHRVGRTGRAGARGVASTFATRSERSDVRNIEHALRITLNQKEVAKDIPREEKQKPDLMPELIERPAHAPRAFQRPFASRSNDSRSSDSRPAGGRPFGSKPSGTRSFGPKRNTRHK